MCGQVAYGKVGIIVVPGGGKLERSLVVVIHSILVTALILLARCFNLT